MRALRNPLVLAALLFAVTLGLYAQVRGHAFVNCDDDVYVTENAHVRDGLTAEGLRWAFGLDAYAANWHPLTWLSHMLDVELFGLDAGAHHMVSAVLHALTAAVLLLALALLTRAPVASAFTAALFALHPLRVESVAWVAERKDVLSGLLFAATLLAYARHARAPGPGRYAWVLLAYALGLMAKPMLVTLPFVLLLLDRWPLARELPWKRLVVEKIPLLALAAASCAVTFAVQRSGGALDPLQHLPLGARLANAANAVVAYVGASFWPARLACFYPHPAILDPATAARWSAAALSAMLPLAFVSLAAWIARRGIPWVFTGWFWFLGMLVPVIGLVQVGVQARADRYTYLPSIGLALAVVWSVRSAVAGRPVATRIALALGLAVLAALSAATWRQTATWKDDFTLFEHALSVTERNYMARTNLGEALMRAGRLDEAARQFEEADRARPGIAPVHVDLGLVLARQGRMDDAIEELERALELYPDYADAHGSLGSVLQQVGRDAEAVTHLERALALEPGRADLASALAWVLATSRDPALRDGPRALRLAEQSCAATGYGPAGFLEVLAAANAELGRFREAVRWQREALGRVPAGARAPLQRRLSLYESGKPFRKDS